MTVFWERFRWLSKSKDGSPNKSASNLGFSSGSVTAWSKGTMPSTNSVKRIADYFGVTPEYMIGIEKNAPNGAPGDDPIWSEIMDIYLAASDKGKDRILQAVRLFSENE